MRLVAAIGVVLALVALDQYLPFAYMRVCNLTRDALARVGRKTPPNPDLLTKSIDACLGTLDISGDVVQKRAEFKRSKGH